MRQVKSDRLRKLEAELDDLEQWLKLGLVPKKDIPKHKEEIKAIKEKIVDEKKRLKVLKESGEYEEYATPKRQPGRSSYTEMPTMPDVETTEQPTELNRFEEAEELPDTETTITSTKGEGTNEEAEEEPTDQESYFGKRPRWGEIIDPDETKW